MGATRLASGIKAKVHTHRLTRSANYTLVCELLP